MARAVRVGKLVSFLGLQISAKWGPLGPRQSKNRFQNRSKFDVFWIGFGSVLGLSWASLPLFGPTRPKMPPEPPFGLLNGALLDGQIIPRRPPEPLQDSP